MMIEAEYKTQNSRDVLLIPLYLALTMGAMNIPMLSFFLSVFILINIQPKHSDVRLIFSLIAGVSLSLMAAARPVAFEQFSDTDVYYGIYRAIRSEEHTSEIQSLMRISYAAFCLKNK